MSRYVLIKSYNPAYNYWLRTHLRRKKILGDREFSWKEAQFIIMDMDKRGKHDDFFQKYFWAWREHPEYSPDYFNLLRMVLAIDKDGKPDLKAMAQLDEESKKRNQRILLTVEDAAKDFYKYYDRFLTKPLARDLEKDIEGSKLSGYFEGEEFAKIPDIRVHGREKMQEGERRIALELLAWLRAMTAERILGDVKETLDQHYDKGLAEALQNSSYRFKSKYVEISAHRADEHSRSVMTYLEPARGHRVIKEGYDGVYYPTYYVELAVQ